MKLCICNDFNECRARKAIAQMSPKQRKSDVRTVYKAATGKLPECGICIPDWEDIIQEFEP